MDENQASYSEDDDESPQNSPDSSVSEESDGKEDVWERLQNEAMDRHHDEWESLVSKFEGNGDSHDVASVKASNALVPTYTEKRN